MARTPKTASSAASDEANSGNSSGEFEWSAPKTSATEFPWDTSYTLPERSKDKQASQNLNQPRIFSVPLSAIPQSTEQAVRAYLMKHHPQPKPGMKDSERKLKELKLEEKQASLKAKAAKDKLAQALFTRSEKLKEIRKAHELETQTAMEELETKLREEHQKSNSELEERIREECKLEYEKKFEEEMVHKRKRDQEEDEKEEQKAKKAKEEEKEAAADEKKETTDGDTADKTTNSDESKTKVQELEKKRDDLKQEMEKLAEKKREMYWLLKQVIKQEAMQKMKMAKLEKAKALNNGAA